MGQSKIVQRNEIEKVIMANLENIINERKRYGIDVDYIHIEQGSTLLDDLELDSLEIMDFLFQIENNFQITFNDPYELVENAETVESIIDYIIRKKG